MPFFRQTTLKRDLVSIIMLVCVFSIILTAISISVINYHRMRSQITGELLHSAQLLSQQSKTLIPYAHLSNIQRKLFQTIGQLSYHHSIAYACIYNQKHEVLAVYDKHDSSLLSLLSNQDNQDAYVKKANEFLREKRERCPDLTGKSDLDDISNGIVFPINEIGHDENNASYPVGYAFLMSSTANEESYIMDQTLVVAAITLLTLSLCYFLAAQLQRNISSPIQELSEATRKVTIYKDYSIRVVQNPKAYSEEINQLVENFNLMLVDIEDRDSRLMRKNVELNRAKEAAESANMSKSQFLANISHELRTPLNAIIGFSSIIVNQLFGPLGNEKYSDYANDIHESGIHLLDIINDILDLSKAEAGKLSLKLEAFNVEEALNKCQQILGERAVDGGVSVNITVQKNIDKLIADRVRFIQIMLNIMSNAIKFTDRGGRVDVEVGMEAAGREVNYFTVTVSDTGIGMRKEDIDMAFETFGQVDSGLDRKYEGTGLGLPLTKKLVDLHNASIRIDSELKRGTKVTIRFISDPGLLR